MIQNQNYQTEKDLEELPDRVADALIDWRKATLDREQKEALLYLRYKGEDKERTATEIRALVHCDSERYYLVVQEIKMEALYQRLYEKLMSAKKIASLRTAF